MEALVEDARAKGARVLTRRRQAQRAGVFLSGHRAGRCARRCPRDARRTLWPAWRSSTRSPRWMRRLPAPTPCPLALRPMALPIHAANVDRLTNEIEAGNLSINTLEASVAEVPFGGVKCSAVRAAKAGPRACIITPRSRPSRTRWSWTPSRPFQEPSHEIRPQRRQIPRLRPYEGHLGRGADAVSRRPVDRRRRLSPPISITGSKIWASTGSSSPASRASSLRCRSTNASAPLIWRCRPRRAGADHHVLFGSEHGCGD